MICEAQKENLMLNLHGQKDAEYAADLDARIKSYESKIKKYNAEKDTIAAKATELEAQQTECKKHTEVFGMGVIFLQISILLSSIAALVKKSPLWYLSLIVGIVGLLEFINGFLLIF